jgi:hypothetical protein
MTVGKGAAPRTRMQVQRGKLVRSSARQREGDCTEYERGWPVADGSHGILALVESSSLRVFQSSSLPVFESSSLPVFQSSSLRSLHRFCGK